MKTSFIPGESKTKSGLTLDKFLPDGGESVHSMWLVDSEGKGTLVPILLAVQMEWQPDSADKDTQP